MSGANVVGTTLKLPIGATAGSNVTIVEPFDNNPARLAVVRVDIRDEAEHEFQAHECRALSALLAVAADELDRINAKRGYAWKAGGR